VGSGSFAAGAICTAVTLVGLVCSNQIALQTIPRLRTVLVTRHFCELSDTAFMTLEWIERATPSVREVEDGHVQHKHRIVDSPSARDHFLPLRTGLPLLNACFCFSPVTGNSNVCFVS
jgi:hypothetical protein